MANSMGRAFSGFFSQLAVVCLLGVFVLISLVAMFTTGGVPDEMDWIGMTARTLTTDEAIARGIPAEVGGVFVEEAAGIAARAGVRPGDVLLAIDASRVQDMGDFAHMASKTDVSKGVQLDVIRLGSRIPIFVFPMAAAAKQTAPARVALAPAGAVPAPAVMDRRWLGIDAETLTAGDAVELGAPAGLRGALIDTVTIGGRAEQAGLVANDVIVTVSGRPVDSTISLWNILASLNHGEHIELGVYRNGQLTSVAIPPAFGTLVGGFPGRMGGQGLGPGGSLICPKCQTTVTHQRGVACNTVPCPSCGTWMVRGQ